ncbi:MAG: hypothetical protein SFY68_15575 [Candidatus Sumerlaeia bacterium]|nr:hypothetical protein [Candidatus Sumerlaeia bacterium]
MASQFDVSQQIIQLIGTPYPKIQEDVFTRGMMFFEDCQRFQELPEKLNQGQMTLKVIVELWAMRKIAPQFGKEFTQFFCNTAPLSYFKKHFKTLRRLQTKR